MLMSTQTLREAGRLLADNVLHDEVKLYAVGAPVTVGTKVTHELDLLDGNLAALVQTTVLANTIESRTDNVYSIKVAAGTVISAGMVVEVISCELEPDLIGKKLLLDKVSKNGVSIIRKAVASDWDNVNQEGKASL